MKVLIMAAGVGSRISRHLHGRPKCCVSVGRKPLIRYTVELLNEMGVTDVALVTGYQANFVVQALDGCRYTNFYNPFYSITNSIASCWCAREFIASADDLVIMNGDVFAEEGVFRALMEDNRSPVMLSDSTRIHDADYRFQWDADGLLQKYGKDLTDDQTTGEYVGVGKICGRDLWDFKQRIVDMVNNQDYNCWWEDAIYRTVEEGKRVQCHDVAGMFWAEVDYIEDYARIQAFVEGHLMSASR
jgi:choline kinase